MPPGLRGSLVACDRTSADTLLAGYGVARVAGQRLAKCQDNRHHEAVSAPYTGLLRHSLQSEKTMTRSCDIPGLQVPGSRFPDPEQDLTPANDEQRVVLGGGCFWCVEAVFLAMDGVTGVVSGYAGGSAETANYDDVCSGQTGHAEVVEVRYQPEKVSFGSLLKVFFSVAHDPTQLDRQGNDRGPQYRSAIFYENEDQKRVAQAYIRQLEEAGVYADPIVTTLEPLEAFYPAEEYHQNFAARNPRQPYVRAVAAPKVDKLREGFPEWLKSESSSNSQSVPGDHA